MKRLFTLLLLLPFTLLKAQIIIPNDAICEPDSCVGFWDQTPGAIAWSWNFGDPASGSSNFSNLQYAMHCYPMGVATYTVTCDVTTNVTTFHDTVVFHFVATPAAAFTSINIGGNTVQFTDQSTGGVVAWTWDFGDATPANYTQNPSHAYASSGAYAVNLSVVDTNGCIDTANILTTASPTGVNMAAGELQLQLFPSPAANEVTIHLPQATGIVTAEIFDLSGRKMLQSEQQQADFTLDVSKLPVATYVIRITSGDKRHEEKLVITRR